MQKQE